VDGSELIYELENDGRMSLVTGAGREAEVAINLPDSIYSAILEVSMRWCCLQATPPCTIPHT
jgi:hypothetical protein